MRLEDFLKNESPDEWCYIGMIDGSSFVLIEKAEDLLANMYEADELIRGINASSIKNAKDSIKKSEAFIKKQPRVIKALQKKSPKSFAKKDDEPGLDYKQVKEEAIIKAKSDLIAMEKYLISRKDFLVRMREYMKNYVPLGDREVVETTRRMTVDSHGETGTVIVVQGREIGNAWFRSEVSKSL